MAETLVFGKWNPEEVKIKDISLVKHISFECLSAAHQAFSENSPYDFALYRLGMIKEKIKVIAYDQESLESTIETGWEVR